MDPKKSNEKQERHALQAFMNELVHKKTLNLHGNV